MTDELKVTEDNGYDQEESIVEQNFVQWTSSNGSLYFPAAKSIKKLKPGLYEIRFNQTSGTYLARVEIHLSGLIKFPDSDCDKVIKDIENFWSKKSRFEKFDVLYKRGVLLWGPPGSGKTCCIKQILSTLINQQKGIVIKFTDPSLFSEGLRLIKEIEPETPVVVLMEDIDSIVENFCESDVINILDGVDLVNNVLFLATTNYPEKLGKRILNRPGRFDKRYYIGMPNEASRKKFIEDLSGKEKINIRKWVEDTDGLAISHIKELFVSVQILGTDYEEALENIKSMNKNISSEDNDEKIGL